MVLTDAMVITVGKPRSYGLIKLKFLRDRWSGMSRCWRDIIQFLSEVELPDFCRGIHAELYWAANRMRHGIYAVCSEPRNIVRHQAVPTGREVS